MKSQTKIATSSILYVTTALVEIVFFISNFKIQILIHDLKIVGKAAFIFFMFVAIDVEGLVLRL